MFPLEILPPLSRPSQYFFVFHYYDMSWHRFLWIIQLEYIQLLEFVGLSFAKFGAFNYHFPQSLFSSQAVFSLGLC